MVIYERSLDINEWASIAGLVLMVMLIFVLPKVLTPLQGIANFLYGIYIGMLFDHTISIKPWDLYDVNDRSDYQVMDFISYLGYGPYSYLFIYIWAKWRIRGYLTILYVVVWTSLAILTEWVSVWIGLFHYDKGFRTAWSVPIYLSVQLLQIWIYHKSSSRSPAAE
jgi:hypothetical protein